MGNTLKMRKSLCWAWCCTSIILCTGEAKASLVCMRDVLASYIGRHYLRKNRRGQKC